MAKLDDFLAKKKETAPVLDLAKATATVSSQEEFRRLMEKVPDFKMRAEKVPPDTIKLRDKFKKSVVNHDKKAMNEEFAFMNPIPVEMRNLDLDDLASVSIDWRMLTTQRPKSKLEEDFFTRLVELARLRNKSREQEKRMFERDPMIRKTKNKAGIVETRVISCTECGDDFCDGKVCGIIGYEAFARIEVPPPPSKASKLSIGTLPKTKVRSRSKTKSSRRKKGARSKSGRKSKSKSRNKSKSPKRSKSKSKNKSKSPSARSKSPSAKKKSPERKRSSERKSVAKNIQFDTPKAVKSSKKLSVKKK